MIAHPARTILRSLPSCSPASSSSARSSAVAQIRHTARRSYATPRPRPPPSAPAASGSAASSLLVAVAALTVGGLILTQRGQVMNETQKKAAAASVAASSASTSGAPARDKKQVNEPVYSSEQSPFSKDASHQHDTSSPAPEIVTRKEAEAEESQQEANVGGSQQQGAFNEETGEINWDCPCLGGMADGPCGEEFKAAFSCFVYSEAEPKGVDCVEKFKGMQDCFRLHPEIYGEEIDDDEEANAAAAATAGGGTDGAVPPTSGGEDIGAVDAPSIKAEAAQGAAAGTA